MAAARNQPAFDFLTGAPSSPPRTTRQHARRTSVSSFTGVAGAASSSLVRAADPLNEELRARIQTLEYELSTLRSERALEAARASAEAASAARGAAREGERAREADEARRKAEARAEAAGREMGEVEARVANERAELERRVRKIGEELAGAREEGEEAARRLEEVERGAEYRLKEAEARCERLRVGEEQAKAELVARGQAHEADRARLAAREAEVGKLEAELLAARAAKGEGEEAGVVKAQLGEQLAHVRKLEAQAREQGAELRQLRAGRKAVEVIEEEKRVLEGRLRAMEELRRELGSVHQQRQALEDERSAWTAYLAQGEGEEASFKSPEDMARAFMDLRVEHAGLVEKLGAIEPETKVKDDNIAVLEEAQAKMQAELDRLRVSGGGGGGDAKAKARLERQRALAVKEVDYLRAQLKMFDSEESEFKPEQYDEQKVRRIKELEDLVDEYRRELQTVQTDLSTAEEQLKLPQTPAPKGKRARDDEDDGDIERLGESRRRTRQLQDDFSKLQTRSKQLESELLAKEKQMEALKAPSRTRILELRNNPTTQVEQIKASTLKTLQEENAELHALLDQKTGGVPDKRRFVPRTSIDAVRLEMDQLSASLAQERKLGQRRKELFSAKANEFRDAVLSLVGWKVNFLPNGRVKVLSIFNNDREREEQGEENSITFDVEKETMKVSGGPESAFARDIRDAVEFWVEGKKEIPCFLAALTLDFYEKKSAAAAQD